MAESGEVMTALMNRLYTVLTDGEEGFVERNASERFITWTLPGMPLDPADLRFAKQGLVGQGETPEEKAKDTSLLVGQASRFARLVDFVPDVTGIFDEKQQTVAFQRGQRALSHVYERVLKQSQVAQTELPDKTVERIERFRDTLYPETEVEDIVTGEVKKTRQEGPILEAYKKHMAQYENAVFEWNDARIKAAAGVTEQDVLNFTFNGNTLRRRVRLAEGEWETAGHKNDVERIQAFIDQVTARDLTLWKADVLDRFERARLSDPLGQEFFLTYMVPATFADDAAGWSTFSFTQKEVEKHVKGKSTQFAVEGQAGWGPLKVSGGVEGSNELKHEVQDVTNFSLSFAVAQIPLAFPWLDLSFLQSRAWRFGPDAIDVDQLSDGNSPPKGMMVGFPTNVIFVRDVTLNFDQLHDETSEAHKTFKGKGSGGYGPFKLGGSYSRDEQTKDVNYTFNQEGLKVEGMQIIGFRCQLLGKAPNPAEGIENFV